MRERYREMPHFMGMYARRTAEAHSPCPAVSMARIFHEGSLVRLLGLGNYGETGGVLE